jgi:hypothetical protein
LLLGLHLSQSLIVVIQEHPGTTFRKCLSGRFRVQALGYTLSATAKRTRLHSLLPNLILIPASLLSNGIPECVDILRQVRI